MIEKRGCFTRLAPAVLAVAGLWSTAGHAEMLLAGSTLITGSQTIVTSFEAPGKGTVTIDLGDLAWPDKFSSLSFAATTTSSVLARMAGVGEVSFDVGASGWYSAVVSAVVAPDGLFNLGMYSLRVDFAPAVPLPPGTLLLLSGLGGIVAAWRGKRPLAALVPVNEGVSV
jgi:hypothetical protein